MMGNFLFEIRASKWLAICYATIAFIIALATGAYLLLSWSAMSIGVKIFLGLVFLVTTWYGYDRITVLGHNKILFYEKGFEVHTKGEVNTLLLADISSSSFKDKNGSTTMTFTRNDGTWLSLDSDDFSSLAYNLEEYGKKVNFDIRTRF